MTEALKNIGEFWEAGPICQWLFDRSSQNWFEGIQLLPRARWCIRGATNQMSLSEHVRDIISRWAQSLNVLKILRCQIMKNDDLKNVNNSVVLAPDW